MPAGQSPLLVQDGKEAPLLVHAEGHHILPADGSAGEVAEKELARKRNRIQEEAGERRKQDGVAMRRNQDGAG